MARTAVDCLSVEAGWTCPVVGSPCNFCGNGTLEGAEECDDGNTTPGDGCGATCRIEPFGSGQGDCNGTYALCSPGLTCVTDNGPQFGFGPTYGVCVPRHCGNGTYEPHFGETYPDCGGECGSICPSCDLLSNGDPDFCRPWCPCVTHEGDCDQAEDCQGTYVCGTNNGYMFGLPGSDVCWPAVCETGLCGGTGHICGPCCGNGTVAGGEICDDSNTVSGDGCSADCWSDETCANGYTDSVVGEQCDDDNTADGDGCDSACQIEIGYTCTTGPSPSDCSICGDGSRGGTESCDDGDTDAGDGCGATCDVEAGWSCSGSPSFCTFCGDTVTEGSEVCDDGGNTSGDGCSADCRSDETCGNGYTDTAASETCDDDNTADGDGCSSSCQVEAGYTCTSGTYPSDCSICGDGSPGATEGCDDGGTCVGGADDGLACTMDPADCPDGVCTTFSEDGCSESCSVEAGYTCWGSPSKCADCGNSIIEVDEQCDDGNTVDLDGCSANCLSDESCGNGHLDWEAGEICDDDNTDGGDGCSADCYSDETCGNKTLDTDAAEECDDGNVVDGDGCDSACNLEPGYSCGGVPVACSLCGDATEGGLEECDDGNTDAGDGCSAVCLDEVCGDGLIEGEVCDDGNSVAADGCSGCLLEPNYSCVGEPSSCDLCGNGSIGGSETCDDGDTVDSGNGCDTNCQRNDVCGDGTVQALFEECDDDNQVDTDCCSNSCISPTCSDSLQNCDETDIDCGGACGATCLEGQGCSVADDCVGGSCSGGTCDATCTDTEQNQDETDVDCGGSACPACGAGKICNLGSDCVSLVCAGGVCLACTCSDGIANCDETDLDCGGGTCSPCGAGSGCSTASDCDSGVCTSNICQPATCTDAVMNGDETDVDCGGSVCSACQSGQCCSVPADCVSVSCTGGVCD